MIRKLIPAFALLTCCLMPLTAFADTSLDQPLPSDQPLVETVQAGEDHQENLADAGDVAGAVDVADSADVAGAVDAADPAGSADVVAAGNPASATAVATPGNPAPAAPADTSKDSVPAATTSATSVNTGKTEPSSQAAAGAQAASPKSKAAVELAAKGEDALEEGIYQITSCAASGKTLDIAGGSTSNGAKAQIYQSNDTAAQFFKLSRTADGFYTLTSVKSGKVLDVSGAVNKAGTSVVQYKANGTSAQKWYLVLQADGSYVIASQLVDAKGNALVLDVRNGSTSNGAAVQVWTANGTAAQSWRFKQLEALVANGYYYIHSGADATFGLDDAYSNTSAGANVHLYQSNNSAAQAWRVAYDSNSGFYTLTNPYTGLALDVSGASTSDGANIQLYTPNGSWAQKWQIKQAQNGTYALVSALSGKAVDITSGTIANASNIQQYRQNGSKAQRWVFARTFTGAIEDGTYSIWSAAAPGYTLDVKNGSTSAGANVQLYTSNGSGAQKFVIARTDSGAYTIKSSKTDLYVASKDGNVCMRSAASGNGNHLWKLKASASGIVFTNVADGRVLDIAGASYRAGSNVGLYKANGSGAQYFMLVDTANKAKVQVPVEDKSIAPRTVGGVTYLFLPSHLTEEATPVVFATQKKNATVLVSSREDKGYQRQNTGEAHLLSNLVGASADHLYVKASANSLPQYLRIMRSANIGSLYVSSYDAAAYGKAYVDASEDHSAKAPVSVLLVDELGQVLYNKDTAEDPATIKGRGNGTWTKDKRPYQIKLSSKASLITGEADQKSKTWVLLANYFDGTNLRNYISQKLALNAGLLDSPDCRFVDFYYDGVYQGNYLLSEKVEIGQGRVEITDLEKENASKDGTDIKTHVTNSFINKYGYECQYVRGVKGPTDITGGYLIERDDYYYKEKSWFDSSAGVFTVKSPEYASAEEVSYISEYVQHAMNVAADPNGKMSDYFDMESLARVFLVQSFARNTDFMWWSSSYFYKDRGSSKIMTGPVWDFDLAYGVETDGKTDPYDWWPAEDFYFFFYNKEFREAVRTVYNDSFKGLAKQVVKKSTSNENSIAYQAAKIKDSMAMDALLWGSRPKASVLDTSATFPTYQGNVDYLITWTNQRFTWLDEQINSSSWL